MIYYFDLLFSFLTAKIANFSENDAQKSDFFSPL